MYIHIQDRQIVFFMVLDRYIDYLTSERRFSPHTIEGYKKEVLQLEKYLKQTGESMDSVDHFYLRNYFAEMLESGAHPNTVNRSLSALRTYFNFLRREKLIPTNPATDIKALKKPRKLPVVVDAGSLSGLLDRDDVFPPGFTGMRDRLVLEFLFGTGVRLSELLSIHKDAIDFYGKQVQVIGKHNKQRLIPLSETLIQQLTEYVKARDAMKCDHTYLFVTDKGTAAYPKLIYRIVYKYLSMVSQQRKRSPHVLRHTFATAMLDNGADLNAIKELLGHAGLSATQVYTHNSAERLKSIYNQAHPRA